MWLSATEPRCAQAGHWAQHAEAWNELWGLPHIEALAQKRDMPFAALAHPKSTPNPPKKIKKALGKNFPMAATPIVWAA
jgi:hypothetical protein